MKSRLFFITALTLCAFLACILYVPIYIPLPVSAHIGTEDLSEVRNLPIVMYHSLLKTSRSKYVAHPNQLESDIIAYKKMGYTPVFLREVVDFVEGKGTLPQKPMVITFDDGHYNNMYYALDIIKRHNVKIVINVITSFCEHTVKTGDIHPNYSCLTWEQMKELESSGLVEIGNHTHAMHKFKPRYGIARKKGEDDSSYRAALLEDFQKAQELLTVNAQITAPITFAYPFGKYTDEAREILCGLGLKALLTCNEGVSKIRVGDSDSLLYLKRYNRSGNTTTETFVKKVFGQLEKRESVYK